MNCIIFLTGFGLVAFAEGCADSLPPGEIVSFANAITELGDISNSKLGDNDCKGLVCSFDSDNTCSYKSSTEGNQQWRVVHAPFGNGDASIKGSSEGDSFAGVLLRPGESAVMETDTGLPEGYILYFNIYLARGIVDYQVCCDSTKACPFDTSCLGFQQADYETWKSANITCPSGTEKIIFKAWNHGKDERAAGLDYIHVRSASDKKSACQG